MPKVPEWRLSIFLNKSNKKGIGINKLIPFVKAQNDLTGMFFLPLTMGVKRWDEFLKKKNLKQTKEMIHRGWKRRKGYERFMRESRSSGRRTLTQLFRKSLIFRVTI